MKETIKCMLLKIVSDSTLHFNEDLKHRLEKKEGLFLFLENESDSFDNRLSAPFLQK